MPKSIENKFRLLNSRAGIYLGAAALGSVFLAGCSAPNEPSAKCEDLTVQVTNQNTRSIELFNVHTVANGAKYDSTTYVFSGNVRSETVLAAQSSIGVLDYTFKDAPTNKTETVTAVINYTNGTDPNAFGSTATCVQTVTFNP